MTSKRPQTGSEDRVIVGDQHAHRIGHRGGSGNCARTRVPPPGVGYAAGSTQFLGAFAHRRQPDGGTRVRRDPLAIVDHREVQRVAERDDNLAAACFGMAGDLTCESARRRCSAGEKASPAKRGARSSRPTTSPWKVRGRTWISALGWPGDATTACPRSPTSTAAYGRARASAMVSTTAGRTLSGATAGTRLRPRRARRRRDRRARHTSHG